MLKRQDLESSLQDFSFDEKNEGLYRKFDAVA